MKDKVQKLSIDIIRLIPLFNPHAFKFHLKRLGKLHSKINLSVFWELHLERIFCFKGG